jgi:RNA polymerase-binding transcription factor DksA
MATERRLSTSELARIQRDLIERITAIYRGVHGDVREQIAQDLSEPPEPRDEVDESQRVQLRDLAERLDEREARLAQAMEAALERIRRGTYGICAECEEPIELERLKLVPWTTRCAEDQQALERETHARPPTM